MFGDGSLTFQEFIMREPLPLATIHAAVLEFLRGRQDAVLFEAQAVNAYVDEPRMTQDVDVLSPRPQDLAEELRQKLHDQFQIAVRTRETGDGNDFRIYQVRKPKNRHLVDIRGIDELPPHQSIDDVLVVTPTELIARKVLSIVGRPKTAKGAIDIGDLRRLLLAYPDLKTADGPVAKRLVELKATVAVLARWKSLAAEEILSDDEPD
jgi:hypothetical protein